MTAFSTGLASVTGLTFGCLLILSACSHIPSREYSLRLNGTSGIQCKIFNDEKVTGTFIVPTTVHLGSKIGQIKADCRLDDKDVIFAIKSSNLDCRDQLVVKGPCPTAPATIEPVEIIIERSN